MIDSHAGREKEERGGERPDGTKSAFSRRNTQSRVVPRIRSKLISKKRVERVARDSFSPSFAFRPSRGCVCALPAVRHADHHRHVRRVQHKRCTTALDNGVTKFLHGRGCARGGHRALHPHAHAYVRPCAPPRLLLRASICSKQFPICLPALASSLLPFPSPRAISPDCSVLRYIYICIDECVRVCVRSPISSTRSSRSAVRFDLIASRGGG